MPPFTLNRACVIGNIAGERNILNLANGRRLAHIQVATNESWIDRKSNRQHERTDWHRVVIINDDLITYLEAEVQIGDCVYVEGKLQTRPFVDSEGTKRASTEIVVSMGGVFALVRKREVANDEGDAPAPASAAEGCCL